MNGYRRAKERNQAKPKVQVGEWRPCAEPWWVDGRPKGGGLGKCKVDRVDDRLRVLGSMTLEPDSSVWLLEVYISGLMGVGCRAKCLHAQHVHYLLGSLGGLSDPGATGARACVQGIGHASTADAGHRDWHCCLVSSIVHGVHLPARHAAGAQDTDSSWKGSCAAPFITRAAAKGELRCSVQRVQQEPTHPHECSVLLEKAAAALRNTSSCLNCASQERGSSKARCWHHPLLSVGNSVQVSSNHLDFQAMSLCRCC